MGARYWFIACSIFPVKRSKNSKYNQHGKFNYFIHAIDFALFSYILLDDITGFFNHK